MNHRPKVIANLPNAGLGNILFVWAKAAIFAHLNNLPLSIYGMGRLKIGPMLRGERSLRYYGDYFKKEKPVLINTIESLVFNWGNENKKWTNPPVEKIKEKELERYKWVVFDSIPHWSDYFGEIKNHRELVKELLLGSITKELNGAAKSIEPPVIGVHIRLGDFREIKEGEEFKKAGLTRTPIQYFTDLINNIRKIKKADLPVTVFTNGKKEELGGLLELNPIKIAPKQPDILDMLALGKSEIVIASASSTFGFWSGFLSEAPLIMHPDHIHEDVRERAFNGKYYEGAFTEPVDPLLLKNIKAIGQKKTKSHAAAY